MNILIAINIYIDKIPNKSQIRSYKSLGLTEILKVKFPDGLDRIV